MERAIVIGSPGAGKSTFARRLRDASQIPLYYLDMIWHLPDRTNVSREEFDMRLQEILAKDRWIIDGNYLRTMEARIAACDTIFLLDYPVELCLEGVEERIRKPRTDMPWVETEFDEEFRQWMGVHPELDWWVWAEQLMVYFLFTYFAGAVYDQDAWGKMKFSFVSVILIRELFRAECLMNPAEADHERLLQTAWRFARELEHSDPNKELMEKRLGNERLFHLRHMLSLLF